ncbi:LolA family protein [Alkalihalobacillus sp. 1P02AB]|uniref:LolA family protein n=1 Tax=Alkalihalobacillus sp. 1P02AB TaxID=3132260 RepID=UPI0039A45AC1
MKNHIKIYMILSLILITGCSTAIATSPEEIIHEVLTSHTQYDSYYGKIHLTETIDGVTNESIIEEKVIMDSKRIVVVTDKQTNETSYGLYDGSVMTIYDESSALAFQMTGELPMLDGQSQLEIMKDFLRSIEKDASLQMVGEETLHGSQTYHLKLKEENDMNFIKEFDLWVNQKNHFILKAKMITDDIETTMEYQEIKFDVTFDEDEFHLDIPDDIFIENLDEQFIEQISINEVNNIFQQGVLVLASEDVTLATIEKYNSDLFERTELTFEYSKDHISYVSIAVFPSPEDEIELTLADEELIEFRNSLASLVVFDSFKSIAWDEDGLRYSLISEHPQVTVDDLLKLEEQFILSSELKE